jgi:hypothetical protein
VAAALGDTDGAKARLTDVLEQAVRDDGDAIITQSLDVAIDVLLNRGEAFAAAVVAAAVETTMAPDRWPDFSHRGPALAVRTANLTRAEHELGDRRYEQAQAEGAAMNRHDALAFALRHL